MELGNIVFGNSRGEYPFNRSWGETSFYHLLNTIGIESYDEYSNDVFEIFPYWWGDCTCGWDDGHKDDCNLVRPNFIHKPSGFTLQWYKYPMRDAYSNAEISKSAFTRIINECIKSL